jgi:hypothetical protein
MIRPRGFPGIAFGEITDGDPRSAHTARAAMARELGIPDSWAIIDQVHGTDIAVASAPGHFGEADGILTDVPMLPMAIATADCLPVVLVGSKSVAVVHTGWRGAAAQIVREAHQLFSERGDTVENAVFGPHIGPCCYEVGQDVVDAVGGYQRETTEGTMSLDLADAVRNQLPGIVITDGFGCTMHNDRFHSFRQNATQKRQVTVAWIPQD